MPSVQLEFQPSICTVVAVHGPRGELLDECRVKFAGTTTPLSIRCSTVAPPGLGLTLHITVTLGTLIAAPRGPWACS